MNTARVERVEQTHIQRCPDRRIDFVPGLVSHNTGAEFLMGSASRSRFLPFIHSHDDAKFATARAQQ